MCTRESAMWCCRLLPLAAFASALVAASPLHAEERVTDTYYHWGHTGPDAQLLTAGGYWSDGGHVEHFNQPGAAAALTQDMIDLIRRWYHQKADYYLDPAKKIKDGGAGLYASDCPLLTQDFGTDLLIVEVTRPRCMSLPRESNEAVKQRYLDAVQWNRYDALKPISRYQAQNVVISRVPRPEENVSIRLRPPTEADVLRIWQAIEAQETRTDFGAVVKSLIEAGSAGKSKLSQIVLDRLLFDHAHRYIEGRLGRFKTLFGNLRDGTDGHTAALLKNLLASYLERLPAGDARIRSLRRAFVAHLSEPQLLDWSAALDVGLISKLLPTLGAHDKARIVAAVDAHLQARPQDLGQLVGQYAQLAAALDRRVPTEQVLRRRLLRGVHRVVRESGLGRPGLASTTARLFGARFAQAALMREVNASFAEVNLASMRREAGPFQRPAEESVRETREYLKTNQDFAGDHFSMRDSPYRAAFQRAFASFDDSFCRQLREIEDDPALLVGLVNSALRRYKQAELPPLRAFPLLSALKLLYADPQRLPVESRRALLVALSGHKLLADPLLKQGMNLSVFQQAQLNAGRFLNLSANSIEAMARGVADDFPALLPQVLFDLKQTNNFELRYNGSFRTDALVGELASRAPITNNARTKLGPAASEKTLCKFEVLLKKKGVRLEYIDAHALKVAGRTQLRADGLVVQLPKVEGGRARSGPRHAALIEELVHVNDFLRLAKGQGGLSALFGALSRQDAQARAIDFAMEANAKRFVGRSRRLGVLERWAVEASGKLYRLRAAHAARKALRSRGTR